MSEPTPPTVGPLGHAFVRSDLPTMGGCCHICGLTREAHEPAPDSAEPLHLDACEHGVRLKNHCATCAAMIQPFVERSAETHAAIREERKRLVRIAEAHGPTIALQAIGYTAARPEPAPSPEREALLAARKALRRLADSQDRLEIARHALSLIEGLKL